MFNNFTASKPIKFNNTGTFAYSGPSFDKVVPNYKMNGTVTVVDQPLTTSFNSTTATCHHHQEQQQQLIILTL